ncbi:MAG TPA: hypothetical protein VIT23_01780 [Terrimicrobiaceae bacterium]
MVSRFLAFLAALFSVQGAILADSEMVRGIRFHPRAEFPERMVGGVFEGTDGDPVTGIYETIYTITSNPPQGWSKVDVSLGNYRYLRYRGPDGSYGNVAEIEFYSYGVKLTGTGFGTPASWNNRGNTFSKAFDGDVSTFFDGPVPNGVYVGVDTGTPPPGAHFLTVERGSGDGFYLPGTMVTVSADPPPAGHQKFQQWLGDTAILSNPFLPTTTAIMPSMSVGITALYSPYDKVRFYPRPGYAGRMVGGVFEGTDGDPVTGPYTTLYTITTNPPEGWSEAEVIFYGGSFIWRYLRYRAPNGSHGNVAEIEFHHHELLLTGTPFGTPSNSGNTFDKALDANVNTFFDAPNADGNYVGIDRALPPEKIRYYPRSGFNDRMVGGIFEGTNGDPVTGPYTTIHTVTSNPPLAWNEVSVSLGDYRYLRYRGPSGSYGNVAEIEFYRDGVKVPGAGFGTPGSWSNGGNTLDKALDANVNTFSMPRTLTETTLALIERHQIRSDIIRDRGLMIE